MAIDNTQIDEAVPPAGTPVRSKTNQLLRDLRDTAEGAASGLDAHKSSGDHDGRYLQRDLDLADLSDAATARTNLGLGSTATKDVGEFATAVQGSRAGGAVIRVWWQQVTIAIDQLLNAILAGWADETLSSRAWRCRDTRRWAFTGRVIDAVFFWQDGHCRLSYERERLGGQKPNHF